MRLGILFLTRKIHAKLAAASNILAGAKIAAIDGECTVLKTAANGLAVGDITCTKAELDGYVENVKDSSAADAY